MVYDFGSVSRENYELKYDFTFTNNSHSSANVSYAVASCSCISLDWTRASVAPGQSGTVSVSYYRERAADSFEKVISVFFAGSSKPVLLRVSGVFTETDASLLGDFPYKRSALGLQCDPGDFSTVHPGAAVYQNIWLANMSSEAITVELESFSKGFDVTPSHLSIAPGSRKELMGSLVVDSLCFGRRTFSFTPVVDGERQDPVFYNALVLPDWSALSSAEINSSAYYKILGDVHHFGVIRQGAPGSLAIPIQNVTEMPFDFLNVQASSDGISIAVPSHVAARQRVDMQVTIDPSVLVPGANKFTVWFVTDSPLKPFTEIEVQGYVEQ